MPSTRLSGICNWWHFCNSEHPLVLIHPQIFQPDAPMAKPWSLPFIRSLLQPSEVILPPSLLICRAQTESSQGVNKPSGMDKEGRSKEHVGRICKGWKLNLEETVFLHILLDRKDNSVERSRAPMKGREYRPSSVVETICTCLKILLVFKICFKELVRAYELNLLSHC